MGPLKMKICRKYQKHAKTITSHPNCIIGLQETKIIFHSARELHAVVKLPCKVKYDLGFLKTYDTIWTVCDSFSIFLIFSTNYHFQGSHIWAVLAIYKYIATLKIKSDHILLLRKPKNPWIWILFFRVPKFWQSGLPYLARI